MTAGVLRADRAAGVMVSPVVAGRWRYFGVNCATVPVIESVEHARFLHEMHAAHGRTCNIHCAAVGYENLSGAQ